MKGSGERLLTFIKEKGFTLQEFCKTYEFDQSAMSRITTGKRSLGINVLYQILEVFPEIDLNWLLMGEKRYESRQKSHINSVSEPEDGMPELDLTGQIFMSYLKKKPIKRLIEKIAEDKFIEMSKK